MSEFFKDMKSLPDPVIDRQDFEDLILEEDRKCTEGIWLITPQGVRYRYSHWLYFHTQHFPLLLDKKHPVTGKPVRVLDIAPLRDTELIINDAYLAAEEYQTGLLVFGSRRIGKTTYEASMIAHSATFFEGSQNVIVGNSDDDIELLTAPVSKAMENIWKPLRPWAYKKDWSKKVEIGSKSKSGEIEKFSEILIRNTKGGNASEALAGITPSAFVLDECGKCDWLEPYAGAQPSFISGTGDIRLVPVISGTSGDFDKPKDAKKAFNNPREYGFLPSVPPGEEKEKGLFMSGLYRFDAKVPSNMQGFLEAEKNRKFFNIAPRYELTEIHADPVVWIKNDELAYKRIEEDLEKYKKVNDLVMYAKTKMYFPIKSDDCFGGRNASPYAKFADQFARHRAFLIDHVKPQLVDLYKLANKVEHKFSDKIPIKTYPHDNNDNLDQPVHVMSFPVQGGMYRLEVIGVDPYNKDEAISTDSLGSVYVMRQLTSDLTDPYRETMVAWYTGRPGKLKEFNKVVELLCEWYNGSILHENSNAAFFSYFDEKNKGHYFMDTWNLMKEINVRTTVTSSKGLAPTPNNQRFVTDQIMRYLEEEIQGPDGSITQGYTRILDPLLLDELLAFDPTPKSGVNTDRVWAFGMAVAALYNRSKWVGSGLQVRDEEEEVSIRPKSFTSSIYKPVRRSSIYNQLR